MAESGRSGATRRSPGSRGTSGGLAITSAIPAVFSDYATLELPDDSDETPTPQHDRAVVALLNRHTAPQPWWLGYLDTGGSDIVFSDVPKVTLYADWRYVLIEAGPKQAATWRQQGWRQWRSTELPDLIFPADRSWLFSTLWDDDWTCIGGSTALVTDLLNDRDLGPRARRVTLDQDATPPGHKAL
jgi:hypothetical protein